MKTSQKSGLHLLLKRSSIATSLPRAVAFYTLFPMSEPAPSQGKSLPLPIPSLSHLPPMVSKIPFTVSV